MIKESFPQEDIIILNAYASNTWNTWNTWGKIHKIRTPKFTAVARYFNSHLSIIERATKENNQGEYKRFKQLLTNLAQLTFYSTLPITAGYTFFPNFHGTFTRIGHMLP